VLTGVENAGSTRGHEGSDRFGLLEDNHPASCVVVYYDLLGLIPPTPPLYAKGFRVYKEDLS
jgi:hypothetical protein